MAVQTFITAESEEDALVELMTYVADWARRNVAPLAVVYGMDEAEGEALLGHLEIPAVKFSGRDNGSVMPGMIFLPLVPYSGWFAALVDLAKAISPWF